MGGAVVIPVIIEILTDPRHDTDTTEPNAFSKVGHKTNKQRPTALFLSIHLSPDT